MDWYASTAYRQLGDPSAQFVYEHIVVSFETPCFNLGIKAGMTIDVGFGCKS